MFDDNYTEIIEKLEYAFKNVDENSMTAGMRAKWEDLFDAIDDLKGAIEDLRNDTKTNNLKNVLYPIGSYIIAGANDDAAAISSRYGGEWYPIGSFKSANNITFWIHKRNS